MAIGVSGWTVTTSRCITSPAHAFSGECRTTSTEQGAVSTTRSAVVPSTPLHSAPCRLAPITIRSWPPACAVRVITCAAAPAAITVSTSTFCSVARATAVACTARNRALSSCTVSSTSPTDAA